MKVRLRHGAPDLGGWLRHGDEYLVLSIEALPGPRRAFRISALDNKTPALFEADWFEVTDDSVPALWIAVDDPGSDSGPQMPADWAEAGFWEAYFDGDPRAEAAYEKAVALIGAEAASPAIALDSQKS